MPGSNPFVWGARRIMNSEYNMQNSCQVMVAEKRRVAKGWGVSWCGICTQGAGESVSGALALSHKQLNSEMGSCLHHFGTNELTPSSVDYVQALGVSGRLRVQLQRMFAVLRTGATMRNVCVCRTAANAGAATATVCALSSRNTSTTCDRLRA